MKFSLKSIALITLGAFQLASAAESASPVNIKTNVIFPNSLDTNKLPEFTNDRETIVRFEFNNNEETEAQIAGYFGSFYYNKKGKIDESPYANLTTSKIGPLAIEPGKNVTFDAKVKVDLPPEDFDLILSFFVGYQDEMIVIETAPIKVTVSDPPVNFFDPRFLFVQIVLGLTVVAIGYVLSNTYLLPYFSNQTPAAKNPTVEKKRVNVGENGYDQSWIPSHHLQATTPKVKKAN